MDPITRDDLTQALTAALQPLLDVTREMRSDIKKLELSSAPREDVYARDVMDEKLAALHTGLESLKLARATDRDFTWKLLGIVGTIITLFAYFAPHLAWH